MIKIDPVVKLEYLTGNGLTNKSLTGFKRLPQSPMVQDTPDDEGNKG